MAASFQRISFQPVRTDQSVSSAPVSLKKKRKRKVVSQLAQGTANVYNCTNCSKEITILTTEPVQCKHCNNRVVDKVRVKQPITYTAD